ncbi:hypothetical protein [Streptomyces sp. NBC_01233]|uniref:hypothetical protein n=1 Tax=Streptomyces sp. NBC_01233 TaxID=2903787 RepID=UPI002E0F42F9|nr:hypothetical protein OG332_41580 [Streptomyces sp. NBC_01233]
MYACGRVLVDLACAMALGVLSIRYIAVLQHASEVVGAQAEASPPTVWRVRGRGR